MIVAYRGNLPLELARLDNFERDLRPEDILRDFEPVKCALLDVDGGLGGFLAGCEFMNVFALLHQLGQEQALHFCCLDAPIGTDEEADKDRLGYVSQHRPQHCL